MAEQYKVDRKKLVMVIASAITLILVLFFTFRKKRSAIKAVIVDIHHLADGQNDLIKEKDVRLIINRSLDEKIENKSLEELDVERIEQVLEQDPFIENAESFVDAAGNLNLKIFQRQPILRVIDNNNLN